MVDRFLRSKTESRRPFEGYVSNTGRLGILIGKSELHGDNVNVWLSQADTEKFAKWLNKRLAEVKEDS